MCFLVDWCLPFSNVTYCLLLLIFTALDMIEREVSFYSEDIGNFWDGSTVLIITVSLFSEGSLFIVPLYFTISPSPSGTMWLRVWGSTLRRPGGCSHRPGECNASTKWWVGDMIFACSEINLWSIKCRFLTWMPNKDYVLRLIFLCNMD